MYAHYVFDIDGTMVDTEQVCLAALRGLLKTRLGRDYSAEECRWSLGIPSEKVLARYGLERTDSIMEEWDGYYRDTIGEARIFDGVLDVLELLRKSGARLGIITSRNEAEMEYDPHVKILLPYFDLVVTAACTDEHKPTPAPMRYYLEHARARAEETLYIGDTEHDWRCANGARVDFALAMWGAASTEGICAEHFPHEPVDIPGLTK